MCSAERQQNNYCWFAIIVWKKRCFFLSPKTRLQQKHANESNEPNLVISGCAANAKVNNASVILSLVGVEKTGIQRIEEWRQQFHANGALLSVLKALILCTDLLLQSVTNTTGERTCPACTTSAWCMTRYTRADLTGRT